jgi:hypothetical protein
VAKDFIFISCGQFTDAERGLGKQIAALVRTWTNLEPFFAEEVHDPNGLDTNILDALRHCVAFIVVMHPRGLITRPDRSAHTRASVWIEQEIAVATYIQRIEKHPLPIIAFKHVDVGREGIRDVLSLNPFEFTHEAEVLAALPKHLEEWRSSLKPSGIQIRLQSAKGYMNEGHVIRKLEVTLVNGTNQRITEYTCMVWLPASIFKHWPDLRLPGETSPIGSDPRRCRFKETDKGSAKPRAVDSRDEARLATLDYCTRCAGISPEEIVEAKVWIDGLEYSDQKTIKELAADAERRDAH